MKRLKIFFATVLLLLALPFWRYCDVLAIISPFHWPLALALTVCFAFFVLIPLKLLLPKIKTYVLIILLFCFGSLSWWSAPFSGMATAEPTFDHCGTLTYTGVFYPLSNLLSEAHRDDLEARNQLCWVRKMIAKVPLRLDTKEEFEAYAKLMEQKLLRPEIKYRVALPLVAILYFEMNRVSRESDSTKNVYDSLHFWINHYTEEISNRNYSAWNWPHSAYIKFEYGLIEKNWEGLINSMVFEN